MEKIGSGTFRVVYAYPSDPVNLAVKVPRDKAQRYGRVMNSEEIKSHQQFPDIFPKTYNDNLDQLVVDRADVIETPEDLIRAVPEIYRLSSLQTKDTVWNLFRSLIDVARGNISVADVESVFGVPSRLVKSIVKKSQLLTSLAAAVDALGIDLTDIDRGNIGVSRRTNRFVLIDASTVTGFSG